MVLTSATWRLIPARLTSKVKASDAIAPQTCASFVYHGVSLIDLIQVADIALVAGSIQSAMHAL
jgi:hypothetical protein